MPVAPATHVPSFVRWCGILPPDAKRGPGLADGHVPAGLRLREANLPVRTITGGSTALVNQVLRRPDVWAVDGLRPRLQTTNDVVRATIGAEVVQAAPWNLDGNGVALAIWDEGDIDHPGLADRLTIMRHADVSEHSTHVAGTMAGNGVSSTDREYRGVAPAATIYSWSFDDPTADLTAGQATGAFWANNSWVYLINNDEDNCDYLNSYDEFTARYDETTVSTTALFGFAFAAGNMGSMTDCGIASRGGFGSIPPPATAKDVIAVGSTDDGRQASSFSSRGPTADGRIKPDIMALGCESPGRGYVTSTLPPDEYGGSGWCGTSMATPQVTGGAALLKQLADQLQLALRPALIKTLLIASAHPLTDGPSYVTGWGSLDLVTAAAMMQQGGFAEGTVTTGKTDYVSSFEVPADTPVIELTLAWDDPAAAETVARTLVNDLELRLVDPEGNEYLPWTLDPDNPTAAAVAGEDHRNNVEQVRVISPTAGNWTVRVFAANLLTEQVFYLAGWVLGDLACDADGDRSAGASCGGDDCDDQDPALHPGAEDVCEDEIDQDCDGKSDEYCSSNSLDPPEESPTPEEEEGDDDNGCGCS